MPSRTNFPSLSSWPSLNMSRFRTKRSPNASPTPAADWNWEHGDRLSARPQPVVAPAARAMNNASSSRISSKGFSQKWKGFRKSVSESLSKRLQSIRSHPSNQSQKIVSRTSSSDSGPVINIGFDSRESSENHQALSPYSPFRNNSAIASSTSLPMTKPRGMARPSLRSLRNKKQTSPSPFASISHETVVTDDTGITLATRKDERKIVDGHVREKRSVVFHPDLLDRELIPSAPDSEAKPKPFDSILPPRRSRPALPWLSNNQSTSNLSTFSTSSSRKQPVITPQDLQDFPEELAGYIPTPITNEEHQGQRTLSPQNSFSDFSQSPTSSRRNRTRLSSTGTRRSDSSLSDASSLQTPSSSRKSTREIEIASPSRNNSASFAPPLPDNAAKIVKEVKEGSLHRRRHEARLTRTIPDFSTDS
jgi:hypothetical protein